MRAKAAILGARAVLALSGASARDFLQGLVTVDIADVAPGAARHGALLTPQGKILFEFVVADGGADAILLDVAAPLADDLVKRLLFYRLRARIEIAQRDDLAVAAIWGGESAPGLEGAFADPRLAALGWRALLPTDTARAMLEADGAGIVDAADYDAHRVALGVPELGPDYATGELFPHEADLDQLAGVDFDKGCFVGQEVVSRMQHRGTARKRFVPVALKGPLPAPGSAVTAGGRNLGTMGAGADGRALALIRLDRLAEAMSDGQTLEAEGTALAPVRPDWARFEWPAASR